MRKASIEPTSIYPVVYRQYTLFQSALNTKDKLQKSTYFKANTLFVAVVSGCSMKRKQNVKSNIQKTLLFILAQFRVAINPVFLNRPVPAGTTDLSNWQKPTGLLNCFHQLKAVVSKNTRFSSLYSVFLQFFEKEYHILVVSIC
jgi:hypothetical protein